MRRIFYAAILIGLLWPATLSAQDETPLWELGEQYSSPDLQFVFNYPTGWALDDSSGVTIAENETDLAAFLDGNADTNPEGVTMRLAAVDVNVLRLEAPTLDNLIAFVVEGTSLDVEAQIDRPVIVWRGASLVGATASGRGGIATLWIMNGYALLFSLNAADETVEPAMIEAWNALLDTFRPLDSLEFAQPVEIEHLGVAVQYPVDWFLNFDESSIFLNEFETDFGRAGADVFPEGHEFTIEFGDTATLELDDEAELGALVTHFTERFDFASSTPLGEFIVLGQAGAGIIGIHDDTEIASGFIVTLDSDTETFTLYSVVAPTLDALEAIQPTFMAFLQNLQRLEA